MERARDGRCMGGGRRLDFLQPKPMCSHQLCPVKGPTPIFVSRERHREDETQAVFDMSCSTDTVLGTVW